MAGRNRGHPIPMKGGPHGGLPPPVHEPPFSMGRVPVPHPALLEEIRESQFAMGHRPMPPHPAVLEEHLASQHDEIQGLLVDNQRLAATHVALKQEVEAAQYELQRTDHYARSLRMETDVQMRELYEKSAKMEMDLQVADGMRSELMRVRSDIKEFTAARQELTVEVQRMTQDLTRMTADLHQTPAIKAEIEGLKQELQRARYFFSRVNLLYVEHFQIDSFLLHSWLTGQLLRMKRKDMQKTMNMVRLWRKIY